METVLIAVSELRKQEKSLRPLYVLFPVVAAGLLVYSQTRAFHWDEGFHILTAYLIGTGKRPYLDFFFPQPPLNAYWNAAWMGIFGPSWRVVHVVAALATMGSIVLLAQYVCTLFPDRRSQAAAALAVLALFGLNSLVWEFGAISQAYAICLLLVVAAFRAAITAVARSGFVTSMLAGLAAGAASASSLLTAAAGPVLLLWMWRHNRAGSRGWKAATFVAGVVAAWAPVLVLFVHGPHQVVFDILEYHSIYRRAAWPGATAHDLGVVTSWVNRSPSLLLVLLAAAGLATIKKNRFDATRQPELRLCLWLALAMGVQNLLGHPTFPQYFIFLIPFLTVLGVVGFHAVVERLDHPDRLWTPVIVLVSIATMCLTGTLYAHREDPTWKPLEQVASKVKQVTPQGAMLLASEHIYFLTHWTVPLGMEDDDAHKLSFSHAENNQLHILPKAELEQQIKSGLYQTTVACDDDDFSDNLADWDLYAQSTDIGECTVYWQLRQKRTTPSPQ